MRINAHIREQITPDVVNGHEFGDGDIVMFPNQGVIAIRASLLGRTNVINPDASTPMITELWAITRHPPQIFGAPDTLGTTDEGRYATSLACALAMINNTDTVVPYFSSRFQPLQHFIPGRRRDREHYRRALRNDSSVHLFYDGDQAVDSDTWTRVGWVLPTTTFDGASGWIPVHRDGHCLGLASDDREEAMNQLITLDMVATRAQEGGPDDDD